MALLLEMKYIHFEYENMKVLNGVNFEISEGKKIGLTGKNGSGKTTLAKIISGEISPAEGVLRYHKKDLLIDYLMQETKLIKNLMDNYHNRDWKVQGKIPVTSNQSIKDYSGGEKRKIQLHNILNQQGDLVILDEPTNRLDFLSRRTLEKALKSYRGTILLITHDQRMMNEVCTKSLIFENSRIYRYEGGLEEYLQGYQRSIKEAKERSPYAYGESLGGNYK